MADQLRRSATGLAGALDRRQFVRRGAKTMFTVLAVFAAGGGLRTATAAATIYACESTTGPGCPAGYGCGPSPCCNGSGRSSGCQCGTDTLCTSGTTNCHGYAGTWSGTSCWTCVNGRRTTTCCDCATTGCGDPYSRCISYYSQVGPPSKPAPGQPEVPAASTPTPVG
jgi:hypothetical protein